MSLTQTQTTREPLRWLFIAGFSDGSRIMQDQDDKSSMRSDGTGSTFSDVLAREKELVTFSLFHVDGNQAVIVDLTTGAFIVNRTPVNLHNQYFNPSRYKLRVVYFRETQVKQDVKATVQEDGSIKQEDIGDPRHFVNRYFIGWQTTVNGKNKQVTLAVG